MTSSRLALADAGTAAEGATRISVEQHFTSNALDEPIARPDSYTLARAVWEKAWQGALGIVKLRADAEATSYRKFDIEDDRSAGVGVEAAGKIAGMELRGTLSYRASSLGDDLDFGAFVIGTRTLSQIVAASLEAGMRLDEATTLVLTASNAAEFYGRARFQDDVLDPVQLDPDTNRMRLQAIVSRQAGPAVFSGLAAADLVATQQIGSPPIALSLALFTLKANATLATPAGTVVQVACGFQSIIGQDDIFRQTRPTFRAEIKRAFGNAFELRGSILGAYELVDTDDPLASWLERGEVELGLRPVDKVTFSAGLFQEMKRNLLYENRELATGGYGELRYDLSEAAALVLRVDYENRFRTVIDTTTRTVDIYVGVRTKL